MITADELRQKFLNFFKQKGHAVIPSASLIPDNDPSVLFTTAGMHPLVPYLMGQPHPQGKRLVNIQKCVRTKDIEKVGNPTHHTFFEMLGNWSLGDYFKEEAISLSFEFLTKELEIPISKLAISVFAGDKDAPRDTESAKIWISLGIPEKRIAYLPKSENWWGPAGKTGPCGPDTEMFYWSDTKTEPPEVFQPDDLRWVEIWNDVFMEFSKTQEGKYLPLKQKNVDTGMGLERTLSCLNGMNDNYRTELFVETIHQIEETAKKTYGDDLQTTTMMRIIADHLRSAVFILGDEHGISPSNTDQGYVLRRLIRRAIIKGKQLGIEKPFTHHIAESIINQYRKNYPELGKNRDFIIQQLIQEEEKFSRTLKRGMREFQKMGFNKCISGKEAFLLFSTYGFPPELIWEIAQEKDLQVDKEGFEKEVRKHQELSRTSSAGRFRGGLADASAETIRGHTATHLLLAALRKVLGDHVVQKGSNITPERLRLDFSHDKKLTPEQLQEVENLVNEQIKKDIPVVYEEMSLEDARKINAIGVFDHKYQDRVRVYRIGDFSIEICGGPHVKSTGELSSFKIIQEKASSAGVRRIKAVVGRNLTKMK